MTRHSSFAGLAVALAVSALEAQVPGELRGRVMSGAEGRRIPLADARVEIVGRSEATRSSADGVFIFRGLEPRAYTVRVRAVGYRMREIDVEIENGRATVADVALDAAARALEAVVVRAARDTQPIDATVFDRRTIEASGRRDVGELLQGTSGVVVTQAGGPGSATRVSIRGSSSSQVLVLLDGVALNSPITGDADLSRVPLETIERVVVHTGAQSARFGPRALAGVIEIRTRRAVREASMVLRTGAWGERNAAALLSGMRTAGDATIGGSVAADYRTVLGNFPYEVPAVRGGGTIRRVNSGSTSRQVLGTLTFDGGTRSASARASAERLDRGLAGSIVQPSITGWERQDRADAGVDATWRESVVSWTGGATLTRERATYRDPTPPFGVAFDDTVVAIGLTVSTSATIGRDPLSVSVGADARGTDLRSSMLAVGAPRWQRMIGAFAGIHIDRSLGAAGIRGVIDLETRVDKSSLADAAVSPRVRARLGRDGVSASASVGAGYSPPSLADQFFHEGVLVRPNPALRPERTTRDVEVRLAARDIDAGVLRLDGDGAVYRADVDGMILWFPDFRFIWSPSNFAVRRSGWEASGRAALTAVPVDVQGTLNHTDVAYTGPVLSGQVTYRPRTTGNVSIGAGSPAMRLEVVDRYVGERRTVAGSGLNRLAPYWRTDARLSSSQRWGSLTLAGTIAVDNLLDRPAAMLVDYPFPGRSWSIAIRIRRIGGPATE